MSKGKSARRTENVAQARLLKLAAFRRGITQMPQSQEATLRYKISILGRVLKIKMIIKSLLCRSAASFLIGLLFCGNLVGFAVKFRSDDPVWRDEDDLDTPSPVKVTVADYYDFLQNTFSRPGDKNKIRALNINTLGEVPDSNWFTNRHGRKPMTVEELVRGPDKGGPSEEAKWQVVQNKVGGISPGFRVVDSKGTTYQLKFDPPSNPEMATAAEVICTKFFHAIGYFVAEDYRVKFSHNQLVLSPKAKFIDMLGKARLMTSKDVEEILTRAAIGPDGKYRAVASKYIQGKPMGEYLYYGTRGDDPNDIFPHEHRRELRGLRVFCAWLNHDDSRSVNTFNTLITENGRRFLRHYLFDFGSTLGSGSTVAQKPRAGNEYLWEPGPTSKSILTLGLWARPWLRVNYPNYPSIGNFEADFFQPENWRPEYPNPAFNNMTEEDAFWAARIVTAFTDEQIQAIVRTGQLTDPKAEEYLVACIIKRRNKVGRYWLNQVNPLDNFGIRDDSLVFGNASNRSNFVQPGSTFYESQWYTFDNRTKARSPVGPKMQTEMLRLPIRFEAFGGAGSGNDQYALVEIKAVSPNHPKWAKPVFVYLRKRGESLSVIGIEGE